MGCRQGGSHILLLRVWRITNQAVRCLQQTLTSHKAWYCAQAGNYCAFLTITAALTCFDLVDFNVAGEHWDHPTVEFELGDASKLLSPLFAGSTFGAAWQYVEGQAHLHMQMCSGSRLGMYRVANAWAQAES